MKTIPASKWFPIFNEIMDGSFSLERAIRDTLSQLTGGRHNVTIHLESINKEDSDQLLSELETLMIDYPTQLEYATFNELKKEFETIPLFNQSVKITKLTTDDGFYEHWHKLKNESKRQIKKDAIENRKLAEQNDLEMMNSFLDARENQQRDKDLKIAKKIARHSSTVPSSIVRRLK